MRPPPAGLLATMRSPNVSHALERITGVFKGSAQRQIILQLSNALQEISAQELLAAADRTRRSPVSELVMASGAVRNPIRENRVHPLEDILQTRRKEGMVLMDNCLYDLSCKSLISYDTAVSQARPLRTHHAFVCPTSRRMFRSFVIRNRQATSIPRKLESRAMSAHTRGWPVGCPGFQDGWD